MITEFLRGCDRVLVLEEGVDLLEQDIRALVQKQEIHVRIEGKDSGLTGQGEYSTTLVMRRLSSWLDTPCPAKPVRSVDMERRAARRTSAPVARTAPFTTPRGRFLATMPSTPATSAVTPWVCCRPCALRIFWCAWGLPSPQAAALPAHRKARGGLYRRFHVLPLRHDGPCQRGFQPA